MTFQINPPTIPLDTLVWQENGDESDPRAALLAHIKIGPVDMHLEAWEVEDEDCGDVAVQCATEASKRGNDLERLGNMMDCAFETIEIEGREYVLVATPFGI